MQNIPAKQNIHFDKPIEFSNQKAQVQQVKFYNPIDFANLKVSD